MIIAGTYKKSEIGYKYSITDGFRKNQNRTAVNSLTSIMGKAFLGLIEKHKYLLTDDFGVNREREIEFFRGWEVFVVATVLAGGRGRPSGEFKARRQEAAKKYLPLIEKEFVKVILS